jgi:FixJ family two-component response regulator
LWFAAVSGSINLMVDIPLIRIVDDDASLRRVLESLFKSVGLSCVSFSNVQEFIESNRTDQPGCLVLDVRMPGISGLDFQAQMDRHGISLPVIMMTGYGDIPISVRAMKAGAVDFLAKPFRDQDMLDAVAIAIQRDHGARLKKDASAHIRNLFTTLSPREQQVMLQVTAGRLNKQIAGDLGLSEITVKIHRGSVMRKMGVRTLADLVRLGEVLKSS